MLTHVIVPRQGMMSAHARLPLRKAGDYPVAIVSVAARRRSDGCIDAVRVAVGSVQEVPLRWESLERAVAGQPLDPYRIGVQAAALATEFNGRDGVEASGSYRVKVLPALVRRAFEDLQQ